MMTKDEIKAIIQKQPTFDSKDEAIQAAVQAISGDGMYEVWKEPPKVGGRYVVAESRVLEILYREKYKRILSAIELVGIACGVYIDDIEKV